MTKLSLPHKWADWLFGTLAFLGVGLLVLGGHGADAGAKVDLFGCALILLAGLFFCGAYRPTQKLIQEIGAPAYTSVSLFLAAILCLPFSFLLAENLTINWNATGIFSLLYLGVGCSWFAYWLWNKGMSGAKANISGLLIALEPVFGVILAVLVLGETISLISGVGIMLIIGATVVMAVLPHWREKKSAK